MHRRVSSLRHGMPHHTGMGQLPSLGPSPDKSLFPSWFIDSLHPRKVRIRATLICLLSLISLTTYICLISPPSLPRPHHLTPSWRNLAAEFPLPLPPPSPSRPDVLLSPEQELGALTAFMAALPQNVIPSNINPLQPIDPQLVLDFDTRNPQAEDEIVDIVVEVWINNPVVLFTKLRSAVSREVKAILQVMDLKPPPTTFDVDQRADADVLTPLLFRLTNATELPILLIGGKPVGSMDTIREFHAAGTLKALITQAGAVLDGSKRHRKGRR